MKTLIVYITNHGCAEKVANMLKDNLKGETYLHNLRDSEPEINDSFDNVIIGASIHAGEIQKKMTSFLQSNKNILSKKKLGLYLCCMYQGEKALEQLKNAFPQELKDISLAIDILGGELLFEKMSFLEKMIVKKVAGVSENVSRIDKKRIQEFANKINEAND